VSKDLKKMVAEIRGALDGYPREQLQEILAWVFKEYVVEGGAAPAQGALAVLDARSELEGLSFAELVTWLQLHLDVPELAALEVQGARVSLRSGGRAIPIEVASQPSAVSHQPSASPVAAQPVAQPPPPQPMPPPNPAPSSHATPPQPPANPTPASTPEAKPEEKKDDASRFSWLEVD
jgi:cell division septation protein DedD